MKSNQRSTIIPASAGLQPRFLRPAQSASVPDRSRSGLTLSDPYFTFTFTVLVVSLPRMSITLTTTRYSPGSA